MDLKRLIISALAALLALSGIGSILAMQHQPRAVEAIELSDDDRAPGIQRDDDGGPAYEAVDDDDTPGGAGSGDDDDSGGGEDDDDSGGGEDDD